MKNAITLYSKYLVQFERKTSKNNGGVYYKASLYDCIEKIGTAKPIVLFTITNKDSFKSTKIKTLISNYDYNLVISMVYICKLLYLSETKYYNKYFPIREVNHIQYDLLNVGAKRSLGINVSKVIKSLYYDEFEWTKTHSYEYH